MKIGILGTGNITNLIIKTIQGTPGIEAYAIASRTEERAKAYAREKGIPVAYGSYKELLDDPDVELVYIATPHSEHYGNIKLCIENGKNVLCEKSFTLNAQMAYELKELAAKKHVYLAEAMWTRYQPSWKIIREFIDTGVIGDVSSIQGDLSYYMTGIKRITSLAYGGGVLLDIGVYGLNFAVLIFGKDIERIESSVRKVDGVDLQESITLFYPDNKMAVLSHSATCHGSNQAVLYGTKGYIVLDYIENPTKVVAYAADNTVIAECSIPAQVTGYEYQFLEAKEQIERGKIESLSMPLDETIFIEELMDSLRKEWGIKYPQES